MVPWVSVCEMEEDNQDIDIWNMNEFWWLAGMK